jgi:anti-sigma regulatory factor (Ser/Thr protein kinase)
LEIRASAGPESLSFAVADKGRFRLRCPSLEAPVKGGLGLPLMVALVDEVSFVREPTGGTRVVLSVLLPEGRE